MSPHPPDLQGSVTSGLRTGRREGPLKTAPNAGLTTTSSNNRHERSGESFMGPAGHVSRSHVALSYRKRELSRRSIECTRVSTRVGDRREYKVDYGG